MDDDIFLISDDSPLQNLLSTSSDKVKKSQLLFEYLSYRKHNKKLLLPPKTYDKILRKIMDFKECFFLFLELPRRSRFFA